MYKVLIVLDGTMGNLQRELNDAALEGYRFLACFPSASRQVIIMAQGEVRRGPGRPAKKEEDDEDKLGK